MRSIQMQQLEWPRSFLACEARVGCQAPLQLDLHTCRGLCQSFLGEAPNDGHLAGSSTAGAGVNGVCAEESYGGRVEGERGEGGCWLGNTTCPVTALIWFGTAGEEEEEA